MLTLVRKTAVLAAIAAALLAPSAAADDFDVNTTKDRLDANPGDEICAAANGKCALRAAVQEANALPGIDNVNLPKGTFTLTMPRSDTPGIAEGDLDLTEAVAIVGKSRKKTIIEQTVRDRVILSNATPALIPGAILADLTVTGGDLRQEIHGGGILLEEHALLIQDAIVRGNTHTMRTNTVGLGGGVATREGSDLTLLNATVSGNTARGDFSTASSAGGGLFVQFNASATITDSRIVRNKAITSGFLPPRGGAMFLQGPTELNRTTVAKNLAGTGGAIFANSQAGIQAFQSTFSGNRAISGGALALDSSVGVEFTNSTISRNKLIDDPEEDPGNGAAIYMDERGFVRLTHVTVADNEAGPGQAAISLEDTIPPTNVEMDINRSIFDHKRKECAGIEFLDELELNVMEDDSCTGGGLSTNVIADPKLKPLESNPFATPGPVTKTHRLKRSSPAIDLVTAGCPPPAMDQRGFSRPQGEGFCDAGSFEAPG